MPLGFYIIMVAQFFSALADTAILFLAIDILGNSGAPKEEYEPLIPLLKSFFAISYVVLAAFVGAFADSMPKRRVMLISNTIKIVGCLSLFIGVHPLYAYGIIGLGAAAYSPAKYGILTEYLPHRLLVVANGWIEGLTVGAIIIGTVLGGLLTHPELVAWFKNFAPFPLNGGAHASIFIIGIFYLIASVFNLFIPDTGVDHKPLRSNPFYLLHDFWHCTKLLWRDKLGQISLAATTLTWGIAGTLHVLVLKWAEDNLGLETLSEQTPIVGVVVFGMAVGAILASRFVSLRQAVNTLPIGVMMGLVLILMSFVTNLYIAIVLLVLIGACGGFFVVPMNALLQHRGHMLMGAGHSIAVQNFNENLSILLMSALYALLLYFNLSINAILVSLGVLVAALMYLIRQWHFLNLKRSNVMAQLDHIH